MTTLVVQLRASRPATVSVTVRGRVSGGRGFKVRQLVRVEGGNVAARLIPQQRTRRLLRHCRALRVSVLATPLPTDESPPRAEPAASPAAPVPPAQPANTVDSAPDSRLTWAPPRLDDPATVRVSNWNRSLNLDRTRDYVIVMPSTPLTASGGLVIQGGRNLVLIGGQITIPWQGAAPTIESRRGLYLKQQAGTVHVEGLLIDGPDLSEGIDLDQRLGATVQLQSIRVEGVHARDEVGFTDNHPDVLQTWSGPAELRVDRLSGTTRYQGFFLHPTQFGDGPPPRLFDLRRVDITGVDVARYLLWQATPFPLALDDVWVSPSPGRSLTRTLWPAPSAWPGVVERPGGEPHVPAGAVGIGYRSPGYR